MKRKLKNKLGSIYDSLTLLVFPILLFVAVIVGYIVYNQVSTQLVLSETYVDNISGYNQSVTLISQPSGQYASFWDFLFMFCVGGAFMSTLVISYLLGNHPVFLIFFLLGAFALVVFIFVAQSFMQQMIAVPPISIYMISFPMTKYFINNFFIFGLVFILGDGIALYAKTASAGGSYGV
jgi:hypothetical protein